MQIGRKHKTNSRIPLVIVGAIVVYLLVQGIRLPSALKNAEQRLNAYPAESIQLSHGKISYVDEGEGEVVLVVHGIFGGYDQAYNTGRDLVHTYRILAPSRFGYPGSDVMSEGAPADQVKAFAELLDILKIKKTYVLGTSAGGTVAIRFALDYPERTKGLILYCSAMPPAEKPETYEKYQGPPPFLCNNYAMFAISPLFEPIMGMAPETINSILPVNERRDGVINDATQTNPDMFKNYAEYPIEKLQVPSLIIHAKDDKLVNYSAVEEVISRFPNSTLVVFEAGGHLMEGHSKEIENALTSFLHATS
jgi:pimeloyl-ACP methyl ester carboxylesterase